MCLKGFLEEVGCIVVVLRLWRIFKIVDEFSAGASEEMNSMTEHVEALKQVNRDLVKEISELKAGRSRRNT